VAQTQNQQKDGQPKDERQSQKSSRRRLFVANLSWDVGDRNLRRAFELFGPVVEARIVKDRDTGRSRGFGFVTFEDPADAAAALAMHGEDIDGRSVRIEYAKGDSGGPRRPGVDRVWT
jgi:heterogeneous nuclear ribonucleoprotein A1/A3